jgi:hypothetical protein
MKPGLSASIVVSNLLANERMLNGVLLSVVITEETEHTTTKVLNVLVNALNDLELLIENP